DPADREIFTKTAASTTHDDAVEVLDSSLFTFDDAHADVDGVSDLELGERLLLRRPLLDLPQEVVLVAHDRLLLPSRALRATLLRGRRPLLRIFLRAGPGGVPLCEQVRPP